MGFKSMVVFPCTNINNYVPSYLLEIDLVEKSFKVHFATFQVTQKAITSVSLF